MKNYKQIVPIVLVVLLALSIYVLYSTKANELNNYNKKLEEARSYREQGIQIDAEELYKQALLDKPSIDLYMEIGSFYLEAERIDDAIEWGAGVTKAYPEDVRGYEYLMGIYEQQEDYIALYKLVDTYNKRKLHSDTIEQMLTRCEYKYYFTGEYADVGVFSGGYCPVLLNEKWGYVDQVGKIAIPVKFLEVGAFAGGLAPVIDAEGSPYYIDEGGNKKHVVMNVENVQKVGFVEDGLFSVFDGTAWGFYNWENEHVFGAYKEVSSIGNGIAAVNTDGKWTLVNREGVDLTGKSYIDVAQDGKGIVSRYDRSFVAEGAEYQLISSDGSVIGEQKYENAILFNDDTYAAVCVGGKWGFIDLDGNKKLDYTYENARSFANGYAAVQINGLWGFIDIDGNVVIEPAFEEASDFNSNGCVFVKDEDCWKLLRLYKSNH